MIKLGVLLATSTAASRLLCARSLEAAQYTALQKVIVANRAGHKKKRDNRGSHEHTQPAYESRPRS